MRRQGHKAARPALRLALAVAAASGAAGASAQEAEEAAPEQPPADDGALVVPDVIVTGDRASVIDDIEALAVLDTNAIAATGAATIGELLQTIRAVTQSADGSEPIFLLNAQRVSGYQEIGALPPEAIEKVEVMPEPVALRFGYPPKRRIVNFITKRDFRQMEVRAMAGDTTRGGSLRANSNVSLTRLNKDSRLTLGLETRHTDEIFQAERSVRPSPDILFDAIGNVTAVNRGAEIDPALSAAAGRLVTVAPVPEAPGDRTGLSGFAAGANAPRLFDLGPYRTLAGRTDAVKAEGVIADKIFGDIGGSLSLSAEKSRDRALAGPAFASIPVPAGHPHSPFTRPVLLQRYLTEADPLRLNYSTTTLNAGATLRGAIAGWRWDFTATLNQKQISGISERGIDLTAANAAIANGANPFLPLDASLLGTRIADRADLRTRSAEAKAVVTNSPVRLPAGEVSVIGTVEAGYAAADSSVRGPSPSDLSLSRGRLEAGLALDLPIASRREDVLAFAGELSLNASANARHVGGFGALYATTLGLSWGPFEGVQLLAQLKENGTAPELEQLSTPSVQIVNLPVFDFRTGRTALVTLTRGGNPDLLAERRSIRSLSLNLKPIKKRELRIGATYEAATIRNQTGNVYAITERTEALLPDLFVRDPSGELVSVTFQPINFFRQEQHKLQLTLSANGVIGKPPTPQPGGTPGPPPINYYAGAGPTIRFSDRLQLRPGTPELDLLDGDTVTGWSQGRVFGYAYGGINFQGHGFNWNAWYSGANRVRSDNPASELHFAPIFKLNVGLFFSLGRLMPKAAWAKKMQLRFEVDNVTDAHQRIRNGLGELPVSFQPDLLDPVGRIVRVMLRKNF